MSSLEIYIPEELERQISRFTDNKNSFIIEAIEDRISRIRTEKLEKDLIRGYKDSAAESEQILMDFSNTDLENWDEY